MIGRPAHDQRPATQYLSLEHSVHQQSHSCKLLPGDGVGEEAGAVEHQQLLPRVLASGVRRNCFSTAFWDTGTVSAGLDAMYAHAWYYGLSL